MKSIIKKTKLNGFVAIEKSKLRKIIGGTCEGGRTVGSGQIIDIVE